ncbi:MAG: carbohydrate kinase, partial [Candidatus Goldbacteria bacterium]|nr:carbohydrate kinase [Candidatus Goldiibacteriota bacterium]
MLDVITIGEILADFVPEKRQCIFKYELRPGGAPSNVAVNLSRWGIKSGIISKVGNDFVGNFLLNFLKEKNVDIKYIYKTSEYKTGLVFIYLDKKGERDFSFYGAPSADQFLNTSEINEEYIKKARVLHFGSISMMNDISRRATLKAISFAKKHSLLISYDPNVRLNLWEGKYETAKKEIRNYFKYADIIKISDTELLFLFNARPDIKNIKRIFKKEQIIFISAGEKGCYVYYKDFFKYIPGYKVKVIDTTGAGDAFMAVSYTHL